ncbi:hypothetical protein BpHYR1_012366 [Brachionus plicatilis]|uniref:Uncharacterized protein n=1 Tax=Brachionus plicatilis TaxID=10195 RepID=A0A3M7S1V8_BRAPC|nr:hypothetical protein BpHYR1_012366 [Brachionus plicatilis]
MIYFNDRPVKSKKGATNDSIGNFRFTAERDFFVPSGIFFLLIKKTLDSFKIIDNLILTSSQFLNQKIEVFLCSFHIARSIDSIDRLDPSHPNVCSPTPDPHRLLDSTCCTVIAEGSFRFSEHSFSKSGCSKTNCCIGSDFFLFGTNVPVSWGFGGFLIRLSKILPAFGFRFLSEADRWLKVKSEFV